MGHKFKKGDRVVIKSERSIAYGRYGTVKHSDSFDTTVDVEGSDFPWDRPHPYTATFSTHNLELVKTKDCEGAANKQESPQGGSFVEKEISLTIKLTGQDATDFENLINELDNDSPFRAAFYQNVVRKIKSEL